MSMCFCGEPLHYQNPAMQALVEEFVNKLGSEIQVTINGRSWMVPRHYIALHGLVAAEVEAMGFPEVKGS